MLARAAGAAVARSAGPARRLFASRVVNVGSVEAYNKMCEGSSLVVTNFTAAWCGPCQQAAPIFDGMSEDNEDVVFAKVDIDDEGLFRIVDNARVEAARSPERSIERVLERVRRPSTSRHLYPVR